VVAAAMIDRLVHHADVVALKGDPTGSRTATWVAFRGRQPRNHDQGGRFPTGEKGSIFDRRRQRGGIPRARRATEAAYAAHGQDLPAQARSRSAHDGALKQLTNLQSIHDRPAVVESGDTPTPPDRLAGRTDAVSIWAMSTRFGGSQTPAT
jgi:hypothetical protein